MREIKNLADVQKTPESEWIVGHSVGGKCPYCGKELPVYRDCCVRYGACDCEVAQAIEEHNKRVLENRKKVEDPSFCRVHHRPKVWLKAVGRDGDFGGGRWYCPDCEK